MFNPAVLEGVLAGDPTLRRTTDGISIAALAIVVNQPVDGEQGHPTRHWVRATGALAENAAAALRQGDLVIVVGAQRTESRPGRGARESATYVDAQLLGPSLRATATRPSHRAAGKPVGPATDAPPTPSGSPQGATHPAPRPLAHRSTATVRLRQSTPQPPPGPPHGRAPDVP